MKSTENFQLIENKVYTEPSVFLPENLLREAKRQRNISNCNVPEICVLDPDGDLTAYLLKIGEAALNECWACYHSKMYNHKIEGIEIGIIPCIVGASYAVLVAEQLFVSGCEHLISVNNRNCKRRRHKLSLSASWCTCTIVFNFIHEISH